MITGKITSSKIMMKQCNSPRPVNEILYSYVYYTYVCMYLYRCIKQDMKFMLRIS